MGYHKIPGIPTAPAQPLKVSGGYSVDVMFMPDDVVTARYAATWARLNANACWYIHKARTPRTVTVGFASAADLANFMAYIGG